MTREKFIEVPLNVQGPPTLLSLGKVVVIDLEMTCWEGEPPLMPGWRELHQESEVIEVGVCLLNVGDLTVSRPRRIFIKPTRSEMSEFCTDLTGITPEMLEKKGMDRVEARGILLDEYKLDCRAWAGWGSDGPTLEDAMGRGIFSQSYFNLCSLFSLAVNRGNRVGLQDALKLLGLEMKGQHHNGGDDAYNAARCLAKMLKGMRSGGLGLQLPSNAP